MTVTVRTSHFRIMNADVEEDNEDIDDDEVFGDIIDEIIHKSTRSLLKFKLDFDEISSQLSDTWRCCSKLRCCEFTSAEEVLDNRVQLDVGTIFKTLHESCPDL